VLRAHHAGSPPRHPPVVRDLAPMKRSVKRLLGQSIFASRLDAVLLRKVGVVVMFHRVQDGAPARDSLTVSVKTFERYCQYFRDWFNVVPLRDLVAKLESKQSAGGELAITFDDGYRDNFENAAPVLERLSLPATFFVVTQWMGTDVVPFWDVELGVRHPWMTWDDVRELHRRGFEIGAHTRTHADLGTVAGVEAGEEIAGGRRELERQLDAQVASFAYPYGGRHHLTEVNRALVRAAGFRCCCSGFGGVNAQHADPFRLRRVPISNWYASPHQLGFDLALRRTLLRS
jgi:peptidoglycan/xylan/chitin deacetylase (PgdA/CDA1 family)